MERFDFTECLQPTISWALSSMIYNDSFQDLVPALFDCFEVHQWRSRHGDHVHAVVLDRENNRMFHVNRGTGGDNWWGKLKSWGTDMNLYAGEDGVHDGAQKYGNDAFNDAAEYYWKFPLVIVDGQSQGAMVAPYLARLIAENIAIKKTDMHIHCDLFSYPPTFNETGAAVFNKHMRAGLISCDRYTLEGDPVASEFFRQDNGLLAGVDVGHEIKLPDIIKQRVANVMAHSCSIVNCAYMQHLIKLYKNRIGHIEKDLMLLGLLSDLIVN
jgi:hypothetical protein